MLYSPSKNACFAPEFRAAYERAGNWPEDLIEIDHALFVEVSNPPPGKEMKPGLNGRPMLTDRSPPTRADALTAALAAIDAAGGAARARYITIAPGQEATYLLKSAQATAFKAGGYIGAVPGLVQAEIDATGATPQQATDTILAQQAAWEVKAAQIESARRRGKVAAGNAADLAAIEAARAAAIAELEAL